MSDINIKDPVVVQAASMIQKSFRGHKIRQKLKNDGPPKFVNELKDLSSVEGSALRIDCKLTGFPDPTVKWFKDGQELKEGIKYGIVFEEDNVSCLVIKNLRHNDEGRYTCKAYNEFGEAFDSCKITIEVPAKIIKGHSNQTVKRGATVTMSALVGGDPEPDVGWAKDGEDIDEDDRIFYDIDGDTTVLTIKNCTKADSGKYEVYVENYKGYDCCISRLDVK